MAMVCDGCGKKPSVGHSVSHSNVKTLRRFNPNLAKKRLFDAALGKLVLRKFCTRCLRSMAKMPRVRAPRKRTTAKA